MAKKAADAGEITNGGSNVKAIEDDIKKAVPEIIELMEKKKAINDEIKEIRDAKIKAHGIKAADFNAMLRIYKLKHGDLDDGPALANDSLTNMGLVADALGLAIQGELFGTAATGGDRAPAGVPIQ